MAKITFLGAAGCVTGSKYLVEADGKRLLVDCGLFQGNKELRLRNWERLPEEPARFDWAVLTHAHLDHTGYLPRLVRDGFRGPIFANAATQELCSILLPDSARLQQEDAEYAAEKGFSKHNPPLPLYTEAEVAPVLERLREIPRGGSFVIPAFAVGRTQTLMYVLRQLEDTQRIPHLPVYVDSPMAISVTALYQRHREDHDVEFTREEAGGDPLNAHKVHLARSAEESKQISNVNTPCIIISASGMATGGRVLFHLARRLPDSRNADRKSTRLNSSHGYISYA